MLNMDALGRSPTGSNPAGPPGAQHSASVNSTSSESSVQGSSIQSHVSGTPAGMSGRAVFAPNNYAPVGPQRHMNYGPSGAGPPNQGQFGYGPANPGHPGYGPMNPGQMTSGPVSHGPMGQGPAPCGPMSHETVSSGTMGQGQMNQGPMVQGATTQMGYGPMGPGSVGPGQMGSGFMGPGPSMGQGPMGPGQMGHGPMGPGPMGHGPMMPGPMGQVPMGPGPMGQAPMGPGPMGPGPMGPGPMGPGPMRLPGPVGPRGPPAGPRPPRIPTHSNNIMVPIRPSAPNPPRNSGPAPRPLGQFSNQPGNLVNKSIKRAHDDGESTKSGFEADLNLKGQHIPQQKCVKTFSIATRGIGFVTAVAYSRLYESNKTELKDISVLSLYRAALAFLELKIYQAQKKRPKTKSDFSSAMEKLWKDVTLLPELERLVRIYSRTLPPIAAVINAIGNFSKENSWYNVGLINDHLEIAHPLTVSLSNLRLTVYRLSKRTTPLKERKHFYEHNPIPGSVWTNESSDYHPLLLNPDEIMPDDYLDEKSFSKLQSDLVNSVRAAELASAKNPLMWEDTLVHLEGSGMGSPAVCASCTLKPLRIPNGPKDDKRDVGYPQITDRMMSMYTDIELSPSERCLGILSLAGELDILQVNDNIPQWAETRSPRGARFVMDCDWMFCASVTGIYS